MVQEESLKLYGMTREELSNYFTVDPTSPSGLRWKVSVNSRARVGDVAGCYSKTVKFPLWRVKLNKTPMVLTRVLWFLHTGEIPDKVDHKDGNPKNNSLENLRSISCKENNQNRVVRNETGTPGVYLVESKGNLIWRCQGVNRDGTRWVRSFSVRKHGFYEGREKALAYRKNKENVEQVNTRRRTLDVDDS